MDRLRCTVASFGKMIEILLATGHIMTMLMVDVPSDGACFFHCLVAFAQDYEERGIKCSRIPTNVQKVRREICDFLVQNRDNPIFVGEITPYKRIKKSYFPKTGRREHIIDPDYNKRVVEAGLSIAAEPYRVSTFDEYIKAMMSPHAFADEIFVEAAGILYGLTLDVFSEIIPHVPAPIHEKTGDDFLDILVEQGFPVDIARSALLKVNRNLDKAIENLLSQPQLSSEPSEKPPSMFHCQSYNTDDGIYRITILNYQNHYQLILFTSGSAAVPEQPAQSCRKSSVGGAAAVPAPPAQPCRKPSARGGGAAAIPHQQSPSFDYFQPIFDVPFLVSALSLLDSVFSTPAGFFENIAQIVQESNTYPQYVEVTGLSIPSIYAKSIQLYGSLPVCKGDNYHPYRGMIFMFDDGSLIQHGRSVDSLSDPQNKTMFSNKVREHWNANNRNLVGIQFERCELKPIPK